MASTKEIRTRLASAASTKQITSAMKMVSAAKLKKAQDAVLQLRPYVQKLQEILGSISSSDSEGASEFTRARDEERVLIIAITSNRGLCGAFNANVAKQAMQLVQDKYSFQLSSRKLSFIAIGKKGGDFLRRKNLPLVEVNTDLVDKVNFNKIAEYAESLMREYKGGKYDKIEIVYNQFKNAAIQILRTEQFLPVPKAEVKATKGKNTVNTNYDFIYEPSKEEIVKDLIPKTLKVQLFKAILDSVASEHGARMTAMHKATDNATELLKELRLQYNKARQSAITNEILEIVGGAEALNG
ncbi:MAG TPA: ATP synthase F1 subunit gamma [Bacteroidales bacterium]|nr:ATP synthase F1 subunit gamma [Bacteroidales bacterium]